uniref:Uncharacterized protein n=1 Tax=Rhizophora mucronata TaxID=61149 RepID=A0A2P2N6A9_RHIMU
MDTAFVRYGPSSMLHLLIQLSSYVSFAVHLLSNIHCPKFSEILFHSI